MTIGFLPRKQVKCFAISGVLLVATYPNSGGTMKKGYNYEENALTFACHDLINGGLLEK